MAIAADARSIGGRCFIAATAPIGKNSLRKADYEHIAGVRWEKNATLWKEDMHMKKYRCMVCGYIYDPKNGDPDGGIAPGTPFEDIPAQWVCPVCGASKDMFEEIEG